MIAIFTSEAGKHTTHIVPFMTLFANLQFLLNLMGSNIDHFAFGDIFMNFGDDL
jgi:hypothetical protein